MATISGSNGNSGIPPPDDDCVGLLVDCTWLETNEVELVVTNAALVVLDELCVVGDELVCTLVEEVVVERSPATIFRPLSADSGISPQTLTPGVTTMLVAETQEDVEPSQYCRMVFESALASGKHTLTSVLEGLVPPEDIVIDTSPNWAFPRLGEPTP